MKIAIYGVSRAGKNSLIERVIDRLNEGTNKRAFHLEGSTTINELSLKKYGVLFGKLTENNKEVLRKEFTKCVQKKETEYEIVFVDGHYAFIDEPGYRVVFTDDDKYTYDAFFYLDTPSDMIIQFTKKGEVEKRNTTITADEIRNWKSFEKIQMTNICANLNKELLILDEDTASCIDFIESYIADVEGQRYNPRKVAEVLVESFSKNINPASTIIMLDCDKTLSENDATYEFCKKLGIDGKKLKQIFRNDRYTTYQFYKVAKLYGSKSQSKIDNAAAIAKTVLKLNDPILNNVNSMNDVFRLGITSGVVHIWQEITKEHNLFDYLVGCFNFHELKVLITPLVKKEVVLLLKQMGKTVYAVGDSMIDIPMLEVADSGFIVAHQKLSNAVVTYLNEIPNSNIKQLSYSNIKYEGITTVEEIA